MFLQESNLPNLKASRPVGATPLSSLSTPTHVLRSNSSSSNTLHHLLKPRSPRLLLSASRVPTDDRSIGGVIVLCVANGNGTGDPIKPLYLIPKFRKWVHGDFMDGWMEGMAAALLSGTGTPQLFQQGMAIYGAYSNLTRAEAPRSAFLDPTGCDMLCCHLPLCSASEPDQQPS